MDINIDKFKQDMNKVMELSIGRKANTYNLGTHINNTKECIRNFILSESLDYYEIKTKTNVDVENFDTFIKMEYGEKNHERIVLDFSFKINSEID